MIRSLRNAPALFVLLLLLLPSNAYGHAELVSGSPGPDETVTGPPSELITEFNQDLDESRTTLEVRDGSGERVARGGELGDNPRQFRLALPLLQPGTYEVRYTSFSAEDGELDRGRYSFTIAASPSPTPTTRPTSTTPATPTPDASDPPTTTPPPSSSPPPAPTASPAVSPTASPVTDPPPGPAGDVSVVLPIFAGLAIVGLLAFWLMRRRGISS